MKQWILYVGIGLLIMGGMLGTYWWFTTASEPAPSPPSMEKSDVGIQGEHQVNQAMPDHAGPELPPQETRTNTMFISPDRLQTIGVQFKKAAIRPLERTIRTVGLVEVDERQLEHVHTKIKGWIEKLYIKFTGEEVKKGQKLFEIYSPELVATQEEYLLALQSLRELGQSEFPEVARGAKDLLEATRRRFQLWDIRPNHIRDLEKTGKVLRTLPLHALISGFVLKIHVREGMYVTPEMEVYSLADLSNVWVLADLYEYEIQDVELAQEAAITLPYFPDEVFQGKVTYIYPVLEPKTRTVKVRFELPNPKWKLKPQMFANVEMKIPLGERLVVPNTAVLDSGTEQLIFVDQGEGKFEPRNVKTGVRTRDWYEIIEGVKPGEQVVTYGNFLIDSESSLKAAKAMMHGGHEKKK